MLDIFAPGGKSVAVDGLFCLSSVAYNSKHDQALVYMLFLSNIQEKPTSGVFIVLSKSDKGIWTPAGQLTSIQMADPAEK